MNGCESVVTIVYTVHRYENIIHHGKTKTCSACEVTYDPYMATYAFGVPQVHISMRNGIKTDQIMNILQISPVHLVASSLFVRCDFKSLENALTLASVIYE